MTLPIRSTAIARPAAALRPAVPELYSLAIRSHVYMGQRQGKAFAALRVFFKELAPSYFVLLRRGLPINLGTGPREWVEPWTVALCAQGFQVDIKTASRVGH